MTMRKHRWVRGAAAALLAAAGGCSAAAPSTEFDCMVEPAQVIEIRSPVVGLLQKVPVRRGSPIKPGDVLAVLESSVEQSAADTAKFRADARGALISAESKLAAATAKARRFQQLYEEEFVSAQARDDAENERRLAEAELHVANDNTQQARLEHRQSVDQLNRRVLRSPVHGVVVDQYLYPGSLVDTSESKKPIMKIAQTSTLSVTAVLPFRYFKSVAVGDDAQVVPEAPFSQPLRAKVKIVDRVVESTSGTFGVVAEIDNTRQQLPGGIRCKMSIGTTPGAAASAPLSNKR